MKTALKILLFLAGAAVIYWVLRGQDWSALRGISVQHICLCALLILVGYMFSGIQYYVSLREMGCPFSVPDIFLFPFMQSFWGIIIPFQGTSLFAMFYLKSKYSFKISQSMAMIIFLYLFNVLFGSLAGLAYCIYQNEYRSMLFLFSVLALFSPLYLWLFQLYLKSAGRNLPVPEKIKSVIFSFFDSLEQLFSNWKKIVLLLLCQVLRQFCYCTIFVMIAYALGHSVHWLWGYLVAVSQEISIILKFTPGNLGTAEMVSGFISHLTNVPVAVGIGVSLFCSLLQLLLILLVGGAGSMLNLNKTLSFSEMRKKLTAQNNEQ